MTIYTYSVYSLFMDAATLFKRWRKKRDFSQEQAAEELGITQASYSRYEAGLSKPLHTKVLGLEEKTGISRKILRPDIYGNRIGANP